MAVDWWNAQALKKNFIDRMSCRSYTFAGVSISAFGSAPHKRMTDDDQRVMGMSDQVAVEAEHPETVTFTRIHESDIELHCYLLSQ